jgi:hypothetical protein
VASRIGIATWVDRENVFFERNMSLLDDFVVHIVIEESGARRSARSSS